jgi:hypothetical protein
MLAAPGSDAQPRSRLGAASPAVQPSITIVLHPASFGPEPTIMGTASGAQGRHRA